MLNSGRMTNFVLCRHSQEDRKMNNDKVMFQFVKGAVSNAILSEANASLEKTTGATVTFEGSVRADAINDDIVAGIEFSAYTEMATEVCIRLMNDILKQYKLNSIKVFHSLGFVKPGKVCFIVVVESPHRKEAFTAISDFVDLFKSEVPVFGKELLEKGEYVWKENQ